MTNMLENNLGSVKVEDQLQRIGQPEHPSYPQQQQSQGQQQQQQSHQPQPEQIQSPQQQVSQVQPQFQQQQQQLSSDPVHPNAKTISTTNSANGSTTTKTNISSPVCRNCKTQTTPLWRRDETGQVLCNACGLFLKLHGRPRPISLKTDVIKSRNRVKHNSGNAQGGKSNPNTPELKAKEPSGAGMNINGNLSVGNVSANGAGNISIAGNQLGQQNQLDRQNPLVSYNMKGAKFSPKQYKPNSAKGKNSPNLTSHDGSNKGTVSSPGLLPLLPRGQQQPQQQHSQPQTSQSQANTPNSPFGYHQGYQHGQLHLYPSKFQHQHLVQPLHYPSSTPAQFAPNLQNVTSPLLLSTTAPKFHPSQSSERASLNGNKQKDMNNGPMALVNAAGALETMSQESLDHDRKIPNIKLDNDKPSVPHFNNLMNGNHEDVKNYSSPSTELNGNSPGTNGNHDNSTKLPALVAAATNSSPPQQQLHHMTPSNATVTSPSFGPQFSLSHQQNPRGSPGMQQQHDNGHYASPSPLPSLKPLLSDVQQQQQHSISSPLARPYNQPPSVQQHIHQLQQPTHSISPMIMAQSSSSQKREDGNHDDDPVFLRTRISELELVNDLYRTRIVELEALENAAKQREALLKKRLDELRGLPMGMMVHSDQGSPANGRDLKRMKLDNGN